MGQREYGRLRVSLVGCITCEHGVMDIKGRVRGYRARLRAQGLRPAPIWVPDVHSPELAREARRQSALVAASDGAEDEQAFVDDLTD
jgi:hypothetical protein